MSDEKILDKPKPVIVMPAFADQKLYPASAILWWLERAAQEVVSSTSWANEEQDIVLKETIAAAIQTLKGEVE